MSSLRAQVPVSAVVEGNAPASATPAPAPAPAPAPEQVATPSVGVPRPPAGPQPGTELPRTGFSLLAFIAIAVVLLVLGRILLAHSRGEVQS